MREASTPTRSRVEDEMTKRSLVILFTMCALTARIYALGPEWVGKPAPGFSLRTMDGTATLTLGQLRGQVVVVDFWASWCVPCKRSLPQLAAMEANHPGLRVIAINIDDERQKAVEFLRKNRIKLIALYDEKKDVVTTYDVPLMPSALIIDRKGVVRYVHVGYTDDDLDQFTREIQGLL